MSIKAHDPAGNFTINGSVGDLQKGDIVIACDPDHAAILQTTTVGPPITYDGSHNCTIDLEYPTNCGSSLPTTPYVFGPNSQIAPFYAADWYVGNNPAGGRSLYRMTLVNANGIPTATAQEMAPNVTGMTLTYLQQNATQYIPAGSVTHWGTVSAVRVHLDLEQNATPNAVPSTQPIARSYDTVVTLYNRVN
jgi:type IV pilus assembly protein PilW